MALEKKLHVGFVALIGRPNSGKSTFINALTGEKVSIVSEKPQTTRKMIKGIYSTEETQIVFFDTPGIHESIEDFNIRVNAVALRSLGDADAIVRFIDASRGFGDEEAKIDSIMDTVKKPVIRVYSKCDVVKRGYVLEKEIIKLSSVDGSGIKEIITALEVVLPEGMPYYEDDYYTDQDPYTRISEIVREKAFSLLSEEIPHDLFVSVEEIEEQKNGTMKALVYIHVEKDSQKRIVIGKGGVVLNEIGTLARLELEEIFGRKVFLAIRVKTSPHWKKNKKITDHLLFGNV